MTDDPDRSDASYAPDGYWRKPFHVLYEPSKPPTEPLQKIFGACTSLRDLEIIREALFRDAKEAKIERKILFEEAGGDYAIDPRDPNKKFRIITLELMRRHINIK